MIYFSELQGRKVYTEDQIYIGKLEDIVFLAAEDAQITKIVVRDTHKNKQIISVQFLINISINTLLINKNYNTGGVVENELFVLKNLLDKQIIDLAGNKVVRVNDIIIRDKPTLCLEGVDIGFLGILRRLKLDNIIIKAHAIFGLHIKSKFLSWVDVQPLELARGHVKLKKREEKLEKIPPEDLAFYLEKTNIINVRKFLKILHPDKAAAVIRSLNLNYRSALFRHYRPEKAAMLMALVDPDEAIDILLTLPIKKRQLIIENLPEKKRNEFNQLLKYTATSIGNLMTTEFITVGPNTTVSEVISKIQKETADFFWLGYIYVTSKNNQLIGVFNLHELLLQKFDTEVYKFMTQNVAIIHLTTPRDLALKKMIVYKVQALPVVNEKKELLGIVSIDDASELFSAKSL